MKKTILTLLIAVATGSLAMANGTDKGWCRAGKADLDLHGNGTATLTCSGNGVCYETDNTGIVAPGHHITIHMPDGQLLDAVVMSSPSQTAPQLLPLVNLQMNFPR